MLHIMTRQFSIVREPDMGHRWRLASCRVCFRSGAGAWEGLARALVFLGQMFQRGGGVQPVARLAPCGGLRPAARAALARFLQ